MEGQNEVGRYYSIGYDVEMFTDVLNTTKHDEDTHDRHHISLTKLIERISK